MDFVVFTALVDSEVVFLLFVPVVSFILSELLLLFVISSTSELLLPLVLSVTFFDSLS
ncbi:hypothetical protein [Clostridium massiliamazoniense]|uniref:hypothetical protein n=1 Tax=Clostridium massiliamazoniense TaxID=1347366 RepID=UPI0012F84F5D|nr:hypothetical protein [Clostridium massiliamazoniense]